MMKQKALREFLKFTSNPRVLLVLSQQLELSVPAG